VIILDEFQYLKDIYMDDNKEIKLIEELFKFFIAITKQNNLAHVVCLTSDSYFLEELYNDTKLANTSDFYLMEHLSKKDISYWLEEKENIDKKIVEKIWKNL
jgi:AAA+ ATPase superfamily predicted ATPase